MGLTKTHAFFALADEDMYDLHKYPFVYMAQARHTRELITMTLKNYIKLGSMVKSESKTLLLNNSARCNFNLLTSNGKNINIPSTCNKFQMWLYFNDPDAGHTAQCVGYLRARIPYTT